MSLAGILTNYYIIIPFILKLWGYLNAIIEMGTVQIQNYRLKNYDYMVSPFNIVGTVISVVVSIIYKSYHLSCIIR